MFIYFNLSSASIVFFTEATYKSLSLSYLDFSFSISLFSCWFSLTNAAFYRWRSEPSITYYIDTGK